MILLKEFIKLTVNTDTMIKNVKCGIKYKDCKCILEYSNAKEDNFFDNSY